MSICFIQDDMARDFGMIGKGIVAYIAFLICGITQEYTRGRSWS